MLDIETKENITIINCNQYNSKHYNNHTISVDNNSITAVRFVILQVNKM